MLRFPVAEFPVGSQVIVLGYKTFLMLSYIDQLAVNDLFIKGRYFLLRKEFFGVHEPNVTQQEGIDPVIDHFNSTEGIIGESGLEDEVIGCEIVFEQKLVVDIFLYKDFSTDPFII